MPELGLNSEIYIYIASFFTTMFVIKMVLFYFVGGDSEVFTDFNMEIDTDCSFNFVSVQSLLAFGMGFGWMGYAGLTQFHFDTLLNIGVAILVGFIFMFVMSYLMFSTKKLEKQVKKDKTTAKSQVGRAYTNFAPQSNGQVEIEVNGQLLVVDAKNITDEEIKAFEYVFVEDVIEDILQIRKN